jgi:hypothetical protein
MITKYKLTDEHGRTYGGTLWTVSVTNIAPAPRSHTLCSPGILHAYHDPLVAILLNPIHAGFTKPLLFEVHVPEVVADDGIKLGAWEMTPVRELDVPRPTIECRVAFGILCALTLSPPKEFRTWAQDWLSGSDRTARAADADAARAAAYAADADAAYAADADAARAAAYAYAARADADAARATAYADAAARATAYADAAAHAARAAAYAAAYAADAYATANFPALADQAFRIATDGYRV